MRISDWSSDVCSSDLRKDAGKQLTGGIEFLCKKNKITWLKGKASFADAHTVSVGKDKVTAKNVDIATGSTVRTRTGVEIDEKVEVDSTGGLEGQKVHGHKGVIGGGGDGADRGK